MGKINILPPDIYNKISAGEVVERPSSVVKELVENCIDAGASRVTINIIGGGLDSIEVIDNGCGIEEDDLKVAFFNHTTSKFLNIADFETLSTLGFRGEALASISAVSKMEVITKTPLADTAVHVVLENGEIVSQDYCAGNVGTKIVVKDLFYNTPARKKFLKSNAKETTEITQYVTRLILTNPFLEVKYTANGKLIYEYTGCSLEEAIFCVYGSECLQNCIAISSQYGDTVVKGYVGTTDYTKPNSTYQTASVNGRYVKDVTISSAVKQAFSPYLMTRSYPFFVLDIQLPPNQVDVNVHPNKLEIRFQYPRQVFYAISAPIREALTKFSEHKINEIVMPANQQVSVFDMPTAQTPENVYSLEETEAINNYKKKQPEVDEYGYTYIDLNDKEQRERYFAQLDSLDVQQMAREQLGEYKRQMELEQLQPELDAQWEAALNSPANQYVFRDGQPVAVGPKSNNEIALDNMRIWGTLFGTYVIAEVADKIVLIDKHAAHERILYEKYLKAGNKFMQETLVPYVFRVNEEEAEFIENNLDVLASVGFILESFGYNTFIVKQVSSLFIDANLKDFVNDVISMMGEGKLDDKELIKDKIAQKACRRAVKAGETLSDLQIEYIVRMLLESGCVYCPHGRPITVTMTKNDLDKMFKRIV